MTPVKRWAAHASAVGLSNQASAAGSEVADLQAGQKVLIHAGAGGVGSFAVQIPRPPTRRLLVGM